MANNKKKKSSDFDVKESLKAAKFVVKNAKHVTISDKHIDYLSIRIMAFLDIKEEDQVRSLTNVFFRPELYPDFTEETVDWLFVFHTLNFSLFNPKGTKQWIAGNTDGYTALTFAIKRAIDEGKPLWDPQYYTTLTRSELEYIFRSDDRETTIPLLNERLMILHEVGNVLLEKYEGTFKNCVKSAKYNADNLIKLLFDEFKPYRDEVIYNRSKVRLYTKANSLVSDIWACYREENKFYLNKKNMMSTMFIDYRSPVALYHYRILQYSDKLLQKFTNKNQPLKHGDKEELEIRACSFVAANKLLKSIKKYCPDFCRNLNRQNASILIDNFLLIIIGNFFRERMYDQYPFHYITSVHY